MLWGTANGSGVGDTAPPLGFPRCVVSAIGWDNVLGVGFTLPVASCCLYSVCLAEAENVIL